MQVQNVSFGKVFAVTGTKEQTNLLKYKMIQPIKKGNVMLFDVTQNFVRSHSEGVLGSAVRRGDMAHVYVTGNDVKKVKNLEKGWQNLDGILNHISEHINLKKVNVGKAVNMLV